MNIVEFYNYSKNKNYNFEQGTWAHGYYGIFSYIVEQNNFKNIAEVGVGVGTHANFILSNNRQIEKLILIDPMKYYDNDAFADDINSQVSVENKNNFDKLYELINEDLSKVSNKYVWIRKESNDITDQDIPDNSLDAIFIDGDHSYTAVLNDLKKYWNKVRSGGQILGDDIYMEQVALAVKDFANEIKVKYDLIVKENINYPIFRFIKP
jgi:hypothetical protein